MKQPLLFIAAIVLCLSATAQYELTYFNEAYTEFGDGSIIEDDDFDDGIWDDPAFQVDLGFDFMLGEEAYSSMFQVGLGAEFVLFNSSTNAGFGYGSDLIDGEAIDGGDPSVIRYKTEGDVGDRIFKIQYENAAYYNEAFPLEGGDGSVEQRINFQIWLYEADGALEYRFGANSITTPQVLHDGSLGPFILFVTGINIIDDTFEYGRYLSGDPAAPDFTVLDENTQPNVIAGDPADGQVYRIAPSTSSVDEMPESTVLVYPTITRDFIRIDFDMVQTNYHIFDITGKSVSAGKVSPNQQLDVQSLNSGVYMIQLDGIDRTFKFVKE